MIPLKRALWTIALLLVAATLAANAVVSFRNTRALADSGMASARSRDVLNGIDDLLNSVIDAETGQRGYLLTQRDEYLAPYHAAVQKTDARVEQLDALLADNPAQRERLAQLRTAIVGRLEDLRHSVNLVGAGHRSDALALVAADTGMALMHDIRTRVDAMRDAERALQAQRDDAARRQYASAQSSHFVGMTIGLLLVLVTAWLLRDDLAARMRAAREIANQREWFDTTVRSIGDAVIVTDPQGHVQLMNPLAEQLTGWSESEALGKPLREVFDIINEFTREPAEDPAQRALREGHVTGLANHTVLRSRDGREYVIADSAAPTRDASGNIQGAVLVFHDDTQRRQSELALSAASAEIARRARQAHAAENTLNTILDNSPIGICMTGPGPDYPIVALSRQMTEWIGAVTGTPALAAYRKLLPDGREPPPDLVPLHRVMECGEDVRDEPWLIERNDGPPLTVIVNVTPVRDEDGAVIGAVHSWVDLTERQRLDHALRVSQSRLRVLVESNVIGLILSFDRKGDVARANSAFLDMLGFSEEDVSHGRLNLFAQTPLEYHQADHEAISELVHAGFCAPYEKELVHHDGTRIPVVVGYAMVADAADEFVGFALDISARKDMERRLRDQAVVLMTADKRKDEFLAMLAHELRNPLAPLRNAVHLLDTQRARDPGFVANLVPVMRRQIDHLVRLVDDLLDAARISQGKITIEHAIVDITPSVHAALEAVQPQITSRGHALVLDLTDEPLYVSGDATRITQMATNILHNAAKYTPNGGRIEVHLKREDDAAVLRVCDNGQGIAAELLPHIFDTFVQDSQSLARSAGGLGVGLALVRRLAELHGGSVTAASDGPGRGSAFTLRLPLASPPPATQSPNPAETQAAPAQHRVLVVDDNVDLAASMSALLDLWGHESRIINSGREALAAALAFKPDVVLLDIGLPEMDGFEIARRIRATPELQRVRLVAITGYGQNQDQARALAAGFDAHLVKPVEPEKLRALLNGFG